jgi:hypothetical protein
MGTIFLQWVVLVSDAVVLGEKDNTLDAKNHFAISLSNTLHLLT